MNQEEEKRVAALPHSTHYIIVPSLVIGSTMYIPTKAKINVGFYK